jgi:hypothetical protein
MKRIAHFRLSPNLIFVWDSTKEVIQIVNDRNGSFISLTMDEWATIIREAKYIRGVAE